MDFSNPYRLAATLAAYVFYNYLFLWSCAAPLRTPWRSVAMWLMDDSLFQDRSGVTIGHIVVRGLYVGGGAELRWRSLRVGAMSVVLSMPGGPRNPPRHRDH